MAVCNWPAIRIERTRASDATFAAVAALASEPRAAVAGDASTSIDPNADEAQREYQQRVGQLTPRELEVLQMVSHGVYNKVIADRLGIAMRTVEVHRAHVLEKMGVRSAVELSQLLAGKTRE